MPISVDDGPSQDWRVKNEVVAKPERLPPLAEIHAPLVNLKDEASNIQCLDDTVKIKITKDNNEEKHVPASLNSAACSMSKEAVLAGLYTNHKVVDELVLGPEFQHQPEANLVVLGWGLADIDGCPKKPAKEYPSGNRQPAIRDCSLTLQKINTEALINGNKHMTIDRDLTDTEADLKEVYTKVDPICHLSGESFIANSDLMQHVSNIHIHLPISMDPDPEGNGGVKSYASDQKVHINALRECSVRLERLPHHEALTGNRQTVQDTTHANTESDSEDIYTKVEENNGLICDICGVRFTLEDDLKKHVLIHLIHNDTLTNTKQEDDSASDQKILAKLVLHECSVRLERLPHHEALAGNHHTTKYTTHADDRLYIKELYSKINSAELTCDICGECFANKSDLMKHVVMHINSSTDMEADREDFTDASDLEFGSRQDTIKTGSKQHVLRDCCVKLERFPHHEVLLRRYTRPNAVVNQSQPAMHPSTPPQSSDMQQKNNLKRHTKNERTKTYVCDICGRTYLCKNSLTQHIMLHLRQTSEQSDNNKIGEKTHRTRLEGEVGFLGLKQKHKTTFSSISTKQHALTRSSSVSKDVHKNEKSYSCEICNGQFHKLNDFKIHNRLHMGLYVFTCPVCQKKFTNSDHYESHKRIHTGERPYSCEICNKTFSQKSHLNYHKRVHTGEKLFACEICDKHYMYKNVLTVHIRLCHTDSKPYSCEVCEKKFKMLGHYKSHIRVHTGEKPYSCEICDKRFKEKHHLNLHIQLHTGKKPYFCEICNKHFALEKYYSSHACLVKRPYSCEICSKKFSRPSALADHKRVHTREKPYTCKVCHERFLHMTQYKRHKQIHKSETGYSCGLCNKKFVVLGNFEAHKRTHTGEKPYACDQCELKFAHLKKLNFHKQSHAGKTYSCDYCKKNFPHKFNLTSHIKKHTSIPFTCQVCNKVLSNISNYNRHKRVHMKNRTFTCKLCHQQFSQVGLYKIHKRIHLGEFLYSCQLCDKQFIDKNHFEAHKRKHSGERPFACNLCDKKFAHPSYLVIHTRTHTGEKPYKCEVCLKRFAQCGDWNKHKRIHTGEKPYSCEICSKRFTESSSLRKHKIMHTGEKPYTCEICNAGYAYLSSLKYHKQRNCKGA